MAVILCSPKVVMLIKIKRASFISRSRGGTRETVRRGKNLLAVVRVDFTQGDDVHNAYVLLIHNNDLFRLEF